MTLAFVTTVRHPHNAADYAHVESLLRDTVASMARQTCDEFVIVIVGNRHPGFALPPRTTFVAVDFPPPSLAPTPRTGMPAMIWDRGTKAGVGLAAARDLGAEYVMFVDADDFVHRGLAAHVQAHPEHPGWVLKRGWLYSRPRNAVAPRRNLFRICGTSYIVPLSAYRLPADITTSASQQVIADALDDYLDDVLGNHRYALEWWASRGRTLEPLPFAGAVYHVDTGENHSGNGMFGPALPHRERFAEEFGIHSAKGAAATLWSCVGPAALKPDLRFQRPSFLRSPARTKSSARRVQPPRGG